MDKASENTGDGEENINKSMEEDYGDAKESKGASSEDEKSPLWQRNQNPWTKFLKMMKMLSMISNNQKQKGRNQLPKAIVLSFKKARVKWKKHQL